METQKMVDPRDIHDNEENAPATDPEINLGSGKRDKKLVDVDPLKQVKEPPPDKDVGKRIDRLPAKEEDGEERVA